MFRFRIIAATAALCAGVVALAGCGGGRTINAGNGGSGDAPNSPFPIAFTVYTDANNNVTYREPNGNLLTASAAQDLINSGILQNGGASFSVFDPTTQTFNPNASTNYGRYVVTVRPSGSTSNKQYLFSFSDAAHPGTLFNNLSVSQTSLVPAFQTNTQQYLQTGVASPGFSTPAAVGASTYITGFSNRFLAGQPTA